MSRQQTLTSFFGKKRSREAGSDEGEAHSAKYHRANGQSESNEVSSDEELPPAEPSLKPRSTRRVVVSDDEDESPPPGITANGAAAEGEARSMSLESSSSVMSVESTASQSGEPAGGHDDSDADYEMDEEDATPEEVEGMGDSEDGRTDGNGDDDEPEAEEGKSGPTKIERAAGGGNGGSTPTATTYATMYLECSEALESWSGEMPYAVVARALHAMSQTTKRTKIIHIFVQLLRATIEHAPQSLKTVVYLCANSIAPAHETVELGIGDATLMRAVADACGRSLSVVKKDAEKTGDIGLVAMNSKNKQKMMFKPAALKVERVYSALREIAVTTGQSSIKRKMDKIKLLLVAAQAEEPIFLIRSLQGKMRVGLAEQSILMGLAHAVVLCPPQDPSGRKRKWKRDDLQAALNRAETLVKAAYSEVPSFEILIPALLEHPLEELPSKCFLQPGIPVKPMLAQPTKGIGEVEARFPSGTTFTAEYKYDGERAQIHMLEDGSVKIYSRNAEDNSTKYPDIVDMLTRVVAEGETATTYILDGEAVAIDQSTGKLLPFQVLSTRSKKGVKLEDVKVPVTYFAFDILYLNGESMLKLPLSERRAILKRVFREVDGFRYAIHKEFTSSDDVKEFLEESVKDQCEGLMIKTFDTDSPYEPGARTFKWVKLKKDYLDGMGDSFDLVPIGAFYGRGKRTGVYGGFLLACYDPDSEEYQSICKIGTGFKDADLAAFHEFFKDHTLPSQPSYYRVSTTMATSMDVWLEPVQVWEVLAADLSISPNHQAAVGIVDPSKGISLRFPRFMRIRDDKGAEDGTTAEQVAEMYSRQALSTKSSRNSEYW